MGLRVMLFKVSVQLSDLLWRSRLSLRVMLFKVSVQHYN